VGLFRNQPGDVVLANADVLSPSVTTRWSTTLCCGNADVERTIVHIDTVPADVDNHYQPVLELRGSVAATLDELTPLLSDLILADGYVSALAHQRQLLPTSTSTPEALRAQGHGVDPAALVAGAARRLGG